MDNKQGELINLRQALEIFLVAIVLTAFAACPKQRQDTEAETETADSQPEIESPSLFGQRCPSDMAYVPPAKICVDLYEYPNISGEVPLAGVIYEEAEKLCEAKSKRLPTAEEWQLACSGKTDNYYPYGYDYIEDACWIDKGLSEGPFKSGSRPECASPFGVYDMTGNVWEWTTTTGFERGTKYVRGGSWYSFPSVATCLLKAWEEPEEGGKDYGFRCVRKP